MDSVFKQILKDRSSLDKIKLYFGKTDNNIILNCSIDETNFEHFMSNFVKYQNIKKEFKHIIAWDKELVISKNNTECKRLCVFGYDFITIPQTDITMSIMTEKNETLPEINFPCVKEYQKNTNCVEYIFAVHEKINLVTHIENNSNMIYLDVTVDDYIDTTIQHLQDNLINKISTLLQSYQK